jgi:Sugar (and other) transporter
LFALFAWPQALAAIGWKSYMINGAWNIVQVIFVAYAFVETKGKTLEEIDAIFDGAKHSDVPDLEDLRQIKLVEGVDPKLSLIQTEDDTVVSNTVEKKKAN